MILNMTGGVGLTKSQIIVTAPTGSAVTCTKGDVVKTAPEKDGTWTFKGLDLGTWTVAATLDGESTSKDVTLERLSIEYVTLEYTVYLYRNGVAENEDITGGWESKGLSYGGEDSRGLTATQNDGYIMVNQSGSRSGGTYKTVNRIDLTEFSTISLNGIMYNSGNTTNPHECALRADVNLPSNGYTTSAAWVLGDGNNTQKTYKMDVSALTGSYYIYIGIFGSANWAKVIDLYLER